MARNQPDLLHAWTMCRAVSSIAAMAEPRDSASSVVALELGFDRFEALTVTQACRAAGYAVELLHMDQNGVEPGFIALGPHRLLVRTTDVDGVTAIIARSIPQAD